MKQIIINCDDEFYKKTLELAKDKNITLSDLILNYLSLEIRDKEMYDLMTK